MSDITLKAELRDTVRKQLGPLRKQGLLPGVIYANGETVAVVQLPAHETAMTLRHMHRSDIFNLDVSGTVYRVKVQDIQRHPVRLEVVHIDFMKV